MNNRLSGRKTYIDEVRQGYKAALKGKDFEKKIGAFLSNQRYKISFEKPVGKDKFDVFGKRYDEDEDEYEYCIAECKDKARVTEADVSHFMAKLKRFYARLPEDIDGEKPEVQGLLAYTGELPRDAHDLANAS